MDFRYRRRRGRGRVGHVARTATLILLVVSVWFVMLAAPVIVRGAPLADDYSACITVRDQGMATAFAEQWELRGAVRPVHFAEIALIGSLCDRAPFGVLIAAGVLLTLLVAYALRGLLMDLGIGRTPASFAATVWLLQPLGTEAALWPSALHVPLGLLLALLSLRAFHRERVTLGAAGGLAACLSLEQVLFALPLLAWVVSPERTRRRALAVMGVLVAVVVVVYARFPGVNERANVALMDRLVNLTRDLDFYVRFPAIGLGLQSVPGALRWAFPVSAVVVLMGAIVGALVGRSVFTRPAERRTRREWLRCAGMTALVAVAMNLPSLSYAPRDDSPRIFTPTWLLVAAVVGLLVAHVPWRRPRPAGALAGVLAAAFVLSQALSVSVRLDSARISRGALIALADRVEERGSVTVCDVPPKVVSPAPAGAFSLHDLFYDWAATPALTYHTGRHATVRIRYDGCPDDSDAVPFSDLHPQLG